MPVFLFSQLNLIRADGGRLLQPSVSFFSYSHLSTIFSLPSSVPPSYHSFSNNCVKAKPTPLLISPQRFSSHTNMISDLVTHRSEPKRHVWLSKYSHSYTSASDPVPALSRIAAHLAES